MQKRFGENDARLGRLPDEWRSDIPTTRREVEQRIEHRLNETQEKYLVARRLGLVCLFDGVVLVAASNL